MRVRYPVARGRFHWISMIVCLVGSGCGVSDSDRAQTFTFGSLPVLEGVVLGGADEAVKKALIDRGRLLRVTHRSELAKGDPRPEFTELRITAHATPTRPKLELTFFNHRLVSVRVFSSDNRALLKSLIEDSRVGTTDHPMLASINTPPTGTACVYLVHAALMKAVDAWIRKYS